jgi:hypothetical protein
MNETTPQNAEHRSVRDDAGQGRTPSSNDPLVEARKLLEEERKDREKACLVSLQAVLKEHGCTLNVHLNRTPEGAFIPAIGVTSQD